MEIAALNITTIEKKNANTRDIAAALMDATQGATNNLKTFARNHYQGDTHKYINAIVNILRKNVTYQRDGYQTQDIKFPGRLLKEKNGDCKSLSLFAAGALTAAGIKNGLRFVAYRPGAPTHVFNYYYNESGQKIPFDLCINDLKETNYKNKIDMDVRYLAAPEIGRRRTKSERKAAKDERKHVKQQSKDATKGMTRKEKRAYKKENRGGKKQPIKRVALAPGRLAFLELVKLNFRNIAGKLNTIETKRPGDAKAFWNRVGGDFTKLQSAIKIGMTRKPLLGEPHELTNLRGQICYKVKPKVNRINAPELGADPATLAASIASAAVILKPLMELFKKKGLEDKDTEAIEDIKAVDDAAPLGENFKTLDPDSDPDAKKASQGTSETGGGLSNINPMLLIGGSAALLLLTKSK